MTNEVVLEHDLTSDDRLWAALSWIPVSPLWPIFAIIALLLEDKKDRPFIRYNAILSIATVSPFRLRGNHSKTPPMLSH